MSKGLDRWFQEKWSKKVGNKKVPCGSDEGQEDGKCRPSKRVTNETPKTWGELSDSEERAAIADKTRANKAGNQYGKVRFERLRKKLK